MNVLASDCHSPLRLFPGQPSPRLYECVVEALRTRHYSCRSEEDPPPRTRPGTPLGSSVARVRKPKRLPVVLTRDEVRAILTDVDCVPRLVCAVLYGAGLTPLEGLALRVKDLHFGRGEITIRQGKGQKDCVTMLPGALRQALHDHLRRVRQQHEADLKSGLRQVPVPDALDREYPNAGREWVCQWVFSASSHYLDRKTGIRHRHHLHESVIEKGGHQAGQRAGLTERVTTRAFPVGLRIYTKLE
jgi:integrase